MALWRKKKKNPRERALEIISRHNAKNEENGKIFTNLQEQRRKELGLHPTLRPEKKDAGVTNIKDPLTKRQRTFLEKLNLSARENPECKN